jgi:hypothetical protein
VDVAQDTPGDYAYLLGLYLGDGHLVEFQRNCWALRLAMDGQYPELIASARDAMLACRGGGKASARCVPGSRCVIVTSYSKSWPELLPQHGPGRKHERPIILAPWQEDLTASYARELVRGLIHSDGCRFVAKQRMPKRTYEYVRYGFTNHSEDIRNIFTNHLELLDIAWTQSNWKTVQIARKDDVQKLDAFIGPKR